MSAITPVVGKIHLLDGANQIIGVQSDSISDMMGTEETTNDADTAVRRAPTLADGKYNFTFIISAPAGAVNTYQAALWTKKAAGTLISFTRYLMGTTGPNYTFTGHISEIAPVDAIPGKNLKMRVTVDVSNGMTYNAS